MYKDAAHFSHVDKAISRSHNRDRNRSRGLVGVVMRKHLTREMLGEKSPAPQEQSYRKLSLRIGPPGRNMLWNETAC